MHGPKMCSTFSFRGPTESPQSRPPDPDKLAPAAPAVWLTCGPSPRSPHFRCRLLFLPRRRHSQTPLPSLLLPLPFPIPHHRLLSVTSLERSPAAATVVAVSFRLLPSPPIAAPRRSLARRLYHHRCITHLLRFLVLAAADALDMLPGFLLPPPPPSSLVLIVSASASVPSLSPSDPPSSSIGASLAIVAVIIIAAAIVTTCIVVLRRGCCRRRLSCSSFSSSRRLSPMASISSSADCGIQSAASAAVSSSPKNRAGLSVLEMVVAPSAPKDAGRAPAAHSAEGSVKGTDSEASSSASAVMVMSGVEILEPSAPPLPEVERVILELLSLPAGPMKAGRSTVCLLCKRQFLPTDVLLVLPVCSHEFHQPCIICWLRSATPSCCPSCHAPIIIPGPDKTTFCSDEYDIDAQVLVPAPPGSEVAETVGGSRGWLRSSLDRLSGSWRGCSSNRATAVAVPVSSRRTTGSWSVGSSGRLDEEPSKPVGSSREWLRSYLATVSGRWSGCSSSCSTALALPVSSRRISTETLGSSGHSCTESRRWDLEAATPTSERPWVYEYVRWFFRSSG